MITWRVRASAASIPDRVPVGRVRCPDRVRPSRVLPDPPLGLSSPPSARPGRVRPRDRRADARQRRRTHRLPGCSDRTIGRRLDDWAAAGVGEQALRTALAGDDPMIGLDLDELSVDGSITKARCPWWRTCARSPGDSTALPPRQHGRAPPCDRSATRADPGPMPPSGIQYVRNSRGQRSRSAG